jgi:RNA polymerase sigma factor (sigma-70 family)
LLVRRYGRLVLGVCRRVLADSHTAEDAFQATFLILVHRAGALDRTRPIGDWLYTVAFRLACRAKANQARRRQRETVPARARGPVDPVHPDDTSAVLHEELNRLPEKHRAPLVLTYLEGRTYEEVSEALGCPVGSVGWRLDQALQLLHRRLTSRGVVAPAVGLAAIVTASVACGAVPPPLVDTTVRTAVWFAGGHAVGTAVPTAAVELARGTLAGTTTYKLIAAGLLVAVGLCGGTAWVSRLSAMSDKPATAVKAPNPVAKGKSLPEGATARMGSSQLRHGEVVFFVAYTADGKHLITAGRDHAIKMWDRATGDEVRSFTRAVPKAVPLPEKPSPAEMVMPGKVMRAVGVEDFPITLSRDGKLLAAGRDAAVTVWDVSTGKAVHELTAPAAVHELVFAPDGKSLVGCGNSDVTVWGTSDGRVAKKYKLAEPGSELLRTGTAVSPGGGHVVQQFIDSTAANGSLRVTDLTTGKTGEEIKLSVGGAQAFTISPDGKRMAWASFTDGVVVWDIAANKQVAAFNKGEGKPKLFGNSIRFSDDGERLAVTLANEAVEVWNISQGKLEHTLGGYEAEPTHRVAVRLVVGASNKMTRTDLAFSADGKTVAASCGNATVRQFDLTSGKEVAAAAGHQSGVVAVGSDGRTTVSVSKESVRVWDAATGQEVRNWALTPPAVAAAVSPDARWVATATGGGSVKLWDTAKGEKVRDIDTKRNDVAGLGFTPDGKVLATKAELNSAINLWDVTKGEHLRTIGRDGEPVLNGGRVSIDTNGARTPSIVFSADGRLVAAVGDRKQVCVWDVAGGALVCEMPLPAVAFAFSTNGQVLAVLTTGGSVVGHEVASGEKRYEFKPTATTPEPLQGQMGGGAMSISAFTRGSAAGGGVGFSADGRFVTFGSGGPTIRVWDTLTGLEVTQFKGHQGSVSVLGVSPDGRSLVSGSVDTTAVSWGLNSLPRVDLARNESLKQTEVEGLWADLARPDPAVAFAAARKLLTDRTQTVALLADRLRPVPAADAEKIGRLIADLGGSFDARRKATAELERLGELTVEPLKAAAAKSPPLDLKQRIEKLIEKAGTRKLQGDQLRELRAVEVLELAASPEAKQVLDTVAKGAPDARLTHEAKSAAERLAK